MDIDILLGLQAFREGAGAVFTEFLSKMTWLGEKDTVLVILALLYWCVSKDTGTYLLMGWSFNRMLNILLKITVCAFRPFVRDARVIPEPAAAEEATGFSFPSGHSMDGASLYGGMAIRRGIPTGFRVLLFGILGLVAFSRLFLGVHTPQDVLVGAGLGILVMFLTGKLLSRIAAHPEKDLLIAAIGILFAVAACAYAALKAYPADVDAAGNLLIDPTRIANSTFKAAGWLGGFLTGWVLERRFVRFSTDVPMLTRFCRLTGGLLGYYAVVLILNPVIKSAVSGTVGTVISCFFHMFFVVFLFPALMKGIEKAARRDPKGKPASAPTA